MLYRTNTMLYRTKLYFGRYGMQKLSKKGPLFCGITVNIKKHLLKMVGNWNKEKKPDKGHLKK